MAQEVAYPARIRIWKETKTWRKSHAPRGDFPATQPGMVETLRLPVYMHPCSSCGAAYAPWGYDGIWYCKEHRP